ncbi:DUF1289 domain-containing protein [Amphritea opalescens]|uniref:DUF1289 domain-containing protein n=1 Tax=Amphritea opalescens TaxID=2490544 RepID=A0A430KMR8_9GAMM|nr:DUF1289 domain-containing protein [Amphritea opalescens]RTE64760.1 DUF1289 domain-containing protein [Amphritea opalescens]
MHSSIEHRSPQKAATDSPCQRNCCLNEQDICMGCYRTLQEILDWHGSSTAEKEAILALCQERRQQQLHR